MTLEKKPFVRYNLDSEKFPQLFISVNHKESDLLKWLEKPVPVDVIAFTAAPNTPTLKSKGTVTLTKITERMIEGSFSGELLNPEKDKTFPIRGEFRAIKRLNV